MRGTSPNSSGSRPTPIETSAVQSSPETASITACSTSSDFHGIDGAIVPMEAYTTGLSSGSSASQGRALSSLRYGVVWR